MSPSSPHPALPVAIVPVRDGVIAPGGSEAAAEVVALGGRVVVAGSGIADAVADLAGALSGGRPGASALDAVELGPFAVGRWARILAPLVGGATLVVLPASPDGRDLAPRISALLGWPLLAGALEVGADTVVLARRGGLVRTEVRPAGRFVATLQPGVRGVAAGGADVAPPEVTTLDAADTADTADTADGAGAGRTVDATVIEVLPPDAATMDLAEATRIVGGGAGLMSGGASAAEVARRFEALTAVGEAVGASMGATRVVTDAGFVSHQRQIGTTGVVVDPRLYLAFGISGAVQHTAGLGHPDHVISVNTDPHCPMMALADLAVVSDAAAVLDELATRLGADAGASVDTGADAAGALG